MEAEVSVLVEKVDYISLERRRTAVLLDKGGKLYAGFRRVGLESRRKRLINLIGTSWKVPTCVESCELFMEGKI